MSVARGVNLPEDTETRIIERMRELLNAEMRAVRSEFRYWLLLGVVANQTLAHVEISNFFAIGGGVALVVGKIVATIIGRS